MTSATDTLPDCRCTNSHRLHWRVLEKEVRNKEGMWRVHRRIPIDYDDIDYDVKYTPMDQRVMLSCSECKHKIRCAVDRKAKVTFDPAESK